MLYEFLTQESGTSWKTHRNTVLKSDPGSFHKLQQDMISAAGSRLTPVQRQLIASHKISSDSVKAKSMQCARLNDYLVAVQRYLNIGIPEPAAPSLDAVKVTSPKKSAKKV